MKAIVASIAILHSMIGNNFVLWENDEFVIKTPFNPHLPYAEGLHLVVIPKETPGSAWEDPELAARTFRLAAEACNLMRQADVAPWFNIQANGNWGLLSGKTTFFHIHIYGRNKNHNWGKPLVLPESPGTFSNDPMPEPERLKLQKLFSSLV